jgi:hypothetical protein
MFRYKNNVANSGSFQGLHPLIGIELRRVEHLWISRAVAPLLIEKSVRPEMNDRSHLEILPLDLLRARLQIHRILGEQRARRKKRQTLG